MSLFSCIGHTQNYETVVEDIVFNSSNRTVITEDIIKKTRARDLPALLSTQANISVISTPFQPTSLSIRGGDSGHVLILVDGVPFYDPSTIQRTGDLAALNIKAIKKIEIIRGGQSVLYGGQALSGIIKIETLSKSESITTTLEGGTQNDLGVGAEYTGSSFVSRGFWNERQSASPAQNSKETYLSDRAYLEEVYRWRGGFIKASYLKDQSFSPSSDINTYQIVDVSNFKMQNESSRLSGQWAWNQIAGKPKLTWNFQKANRHFTFPLSPLNSFLINEDYDSTIQFLRLDLRPLQEKGFFLDAGLNYNYEDFLFFDTAIKKAEAFLEHRGAFIKATHALGEKFTLSAGTRIENGAHQRPVYAYQVGVSYQNTKFEWATSYKAPSLYQLHSNYGNPDLKEERGSQTSLTQEWQDGASSGVSLSLFYSRYQNLITTTGTFPNLVYANTNKTETYGAEGVVTARLRRDDSVQLALGYQQPRDLSTHAWLPRRPLVNGRLRVILSDRQITQVAEIVSLGPRKDLGPNGTVTLPAYTAANWSATYHLQNENDLSIRVNNLFSARYQDTYGYYAEKIGATVGWTKNW